MSIPALADYEMPSAGEAGDRVDWSPDPDRAVLLIHDMQQYFLSFWPENSPLINTLLRHTEQLKAYAISQGIPVVYTAQPKHQSSEERGLLNDMWGPGLQRTPEQQKIVPQLEPGERDTVLVKWRYSAFYHSPLEDMMKELGRDQLIITGVYAHIGCMTTAVEAFSRNIQPFFVADAMADFSREEHLMAMNYISGRAGRVMNTEDLIRSMSRTLTREMLHSRVMSLIDEEDEPYFNADESLVDYGVDSIQVMTMITEWREYGIVLSFEELARNPSLNAWWDLIESRQQGAQGQ